MQLAKPDPIRSIRWLCCVFLFLLASSTLSFAQDRKPDDCSQIKGSSAAAVLQYKLCQASSLEPLDPTRREWYGEFYSPQKFIECIKREPLNAGCDRYRLKRVEQPEYWPYDGKVPSVKWPEAPSQSVYRKGMTPKQYFDALCKAEAGEFIYRRVENVDGIYQIRPRLRATDYELRDRYVMEDPYGYSGTDHSNPQDNLVQPPFGGYRFLETPNPETPTKSRYLQFYRGDPVPGKTTQHMVRRRDGNYSGVAVPYLVRKAGVEELKSRYGFTWRGIKRLHDRDNSIAGGELAVVDLKTNEVLGIRRGFAMTRSKDSARGTNWEVAAECPPNILASGSNRFLHHVLKPSPTDQGEDHARK